METPSDRLLRGLVLLLGAGSLACAPAGRMGDEIHIAEESAIIIWDAAAKTQHFIRRASFQTKAKDFGFLVPTPTVPVLAEADDEVFEFLETVTKPPVEEAVRQGGKPMAVAAGPMKASAVKVISTAKVAGFEAAVLEASDAESLNLWLGRNGYSSSPELVEWFKPYIERKWMLTAFKIDIASATSDRASESAVRMTFRTDEPYFPYREPATRHAAGSATKPRLLRVYFLGDARVEGRIGEDGKWPGEELWSDRIEPAQLARLLALANIGAAPALQPWLTRFQDRSSPRPGTDEVRFFRSQTQAAVRAGAERYFTPGSEPPQNVPSTNFRDFLTLLLLLGGGPAGLGLYLLWRARTRN